MSDFESYEPEPYQEVESKSVLGEAFVADESFSNFTSDINKEKAIEGLSMQQRSILYKFAKNHDDSIGFNWKTEFLPDDIYDQVVALGDSETLNIDIERFVIDTVTEVFQPKETIEEKYAKITEELSFGQDRKTYKRLNNLPTVKDEETGAKGLVGYNDQPNKELGLWYVKFKKDLGYNSALETDPEEEIDYSEDNDHIVGQARQHMNRGNKSRNEDIMDDERFSQWQKGGEKLANEDDMDDIQSKKDHDEDGKVKADRFKSASDFRKSLKSSEVNWDKLEGKKIIDKGSHYETEDGETITWSSFDATRAQSFLKQRASENELNYEDTEFGSNKDGEIKPFEGKPESEDAVKSTIDEVNFAEELDLSSLYNSDIYHSELPERKEQAQESVVDLSLQDAQGKAEESELEAKIINRKLNGYGEEAIAKELYVWHDMEREQSIPLIRSVEVNTDDRAAYTLFGKRLHMLNARELDELKALSGF